ncbi:MAG: hypothetical protein ACI8Y3_001243, partial [Paraglaciecola sp.]
MVMVISVDVCLVTLNIMITWNLLHSKEKLRRAPTLENLLVHYVPDDIEFANVIDTITKSGFIKVDSFNPYWDSSAQTFEYVDGYRVVINNGA